MDQAKVLHAVNVAPAVLVRIGWPQFVSQGLVSELNADISHRLDAAESGK